MNSSSPISWIPAAYELRAAGVRYLSGPPGLTRGTSQCGYGCSDHASWNTQGFPAALVFEGGHAQQRPYIHSISDTLANMGNSAQHSVTFAKLALAFLGETAKGAVDPLVLERVYANGFE
ncbi:MAG: hypothetical protein R3F10_10025 [Lysobacteraceae bacterium]